MNWYNDNEPYVAQWLRNLIDAGHIGQGIVDERSIKDIKPDELTGFTRCHFFAGIAGWELALNRAGWPADEPVWTGSCPCQPFSAAGKRKGHEDERHLWPSWFELIRVCKPPTIFGEQVESAIGMGWLDRVFDDLEAEGYSCGAIVLPACSVGAPHIRQRIFWSAYSSEYGRKRIQRSSEEQVQENGTFETLDAWHGTGNPFEEWKKLLAKTRVDKLDDGISSTMAIRPALKCFGNSIVPQVAAEFIKAVMEEP